MSKLLAKAIIALNVVAMGIGAIIFVNVLITRLTTTPKPVISAPITMVDPTPKECMHLYKGRDGAPLYRVGSCS